MTMKYFQHNNMILDLRKKRITKTGVEIVNMEHDNNCRFILRHLSIHFNNKLYFDKNNEKTLELYIDEKIIHNYEDYKENIKNALIVARKYANDVGLDLVAKFSININRPYIVNCITNNNNDRIFPMLYSELCQAKENNIPITIRPKGKGLCNTIKISNIGDNKNLYMLPDKLKTTIILDDNDVTNISILLKSKNKMSYDFSNIHIDNRNCEDKIIEFNPYYRHPNENFLYNLIQDIDFKPPTSTCVENSFGRNHFILCDNVGLLSNKAADRFYEKNRLSIIDLGLDIEKFTKKLRDELLLNNNKKPFIKDIINKVLYINKKNKKNDIFLKEECNHIRDILVKFKKEIISLEPEI